VLSDTATLRSQRREACFAAFTSRWRDRVAITYRRRTVHWLQGVNIREFCERWGGKHDFAVTSTPTVSLTADAVLRLGRIMQAIPKLGILQG